MKTTQEERDELREFTAVTTAAHGIGGDHYGDLIRRLLSDADRCAELDALYTCRKCGDKIKMDDLCFECRYDEGGP